MRQENNRYRKRPKEEGGRKNCINKATDWVSICCACISPKEWRDDQIHLGTLKLMKSWCWTEPEQTRAADPDSAVGSALQEPGSALVGGDNQHKDRIIHRGTQTATPGRSGNPSLLSGSSNEIQRAATTPEWQTNPGKFCHNSDKAKERAAHAAPLPMERTPSREDEELLQGTDLCWCCALCREQHTLQPHSPGSAVSAGTGRSLCPPRLPQGFHSSTHRMNTQPSSWASSKGKSTTADTKGCWTHPDLPGTAQTNRGLARIKY